ncbi:hypothetical protein DUI87_16614 [Hirundo rustica rustica]|uniref:Uncharacterized protein n=1 Tax=Hirundo rustica rustica TaxID=333673 RepID=A0A3M0K2D3_HIRRU|nr:hypothetical protein DUI87_16614 [Hirundo rustica rustica]
MATFFGLGHLHPMKGSTAPVCSTPQEFLCSIVEKEEIPLVSQPKTDEKAEVAQPSDTGGAVKRKKEEPQGGSSCCPKLYPPLPNSDEESGLDPNEYVVNSEDEDRKPSSVPKKEEKSKDGEHNKLQELLQKLAELSTQQEKLEERINSISTLWKAADTSLLTP